MDVDVLVRLDSGCGEPKTRPSELSIENDVLSGVQQAVLNDATLDVMEVKILRAEDCQVVVSECGLEIDEDGLTGLPFTTLKIFGGGNWVADEFLSTEVAGDSIAELVMYSINAKASRRSRVGSAATAEAESSEKSFTPAEPHRRGHRKSNETVTAFPRPHRTENPAKCRP